MVALVVSLLLSTNSFAGWANIPKIRAKDYSCSEIQGLIRANGRLRIQSGIFSGVYYYSSSQCHFTEKGQISYFKAKNKEPCYGLICTHDFGRDHY